MSTSRVRVRGWAAARAPVGASGSAVPRVGTGRGSSGSSPPVAYPRRSGGNRSGAGRFGGLVGRVRGMVLSSDVLFDRGLDLFGDVVGEVSPEAWDAPSPCEGWSALD